MKIKIALAALAVFCLGEASALAAKPQKPAPLPPQAAAYVAIENTAPGALASEAGYAEFFAGLGETAKVDVGSYRKDGAGVVARDVAFTAAGDNAVGLRVKELRLYDGEKKRIDARGVTVFGMEAALNRANQSIEKAVAEMAEGAAPAPQIKYEKLEVSIGKIVVDGFAFHAPTPAELAAKTAKKESAEPNLGLELANLARMNRMMSAEAYIARDLKWMFGFTDDAGANEMSFAADFTGARGMDRGDLDEAVMANLTFAMKAPSKEAGAPIDMTGGVKSYSISGVKLAKLYDYWANGETPPAKETDLLSLGVWKAAGEYYDFSGERIYSAEEIVTDFSNFYRYLPVAITSTSKNVVYDIGALMRFGAKVTPTPPKEGEPTPQEIASLLDRHGLSKIVLSGVADYRWNPKTGATAFTSNNQLAELGALDFTLGANLPNAKRALSLETQSSGEKGEEVWTNAIEDIKLVDFSTTIRDRGLLNKLFALGAELAPAGGGQGAAKPNELRSTAAMMVRLNGGSPAITAIATAFADFISEGGSITLRAKPKKPLAITDMALSAGADPVDFFGITAEHTPD
ncbi:MAG: hypothetical protein R3C58_09930 [Parvularculaceae bacterium]